MQRRAFTLTELLVVIGILLLLSSLTLVVFSGRNTDRIRSAARTAQSAFLGAKDRAMNAKDFRGLRLIRDNNGPTLPNGDFALVTGFVYVQPIPHESYPSGSIQLERTANDPNDWTQGAANSDVVLVHGNGIGKNAVDWDFVYPRFASPGQIRIPAGTGAWYTFTVDTTGPYQLKPGNEYLRLQVPYTATSPVLPFNSVVAFPSSNKSTSGCDIQFGFEVLPFHQPISLTAGVVIDLRYSTINTQTLPTNADIVFSPRGTVGGVTGGSGSIYLCLRDIDDAMQNLDPANQACKGETLLLAVNPQTGLVQTYAGDLTDLDKDGIADNLFSFARNGKAAGR